MELHAAGILAGLAAAVFAAQCAATRATVAVLLAAFAVAMLALEWTALLPPATVGFCTLGLAAASFAQPRWRLLAPFAAGFSAAAWVSVLRAQGLPWLPATVAVALVAVAAVGLAARRRAFVTAELRDEALLLVAAFALLVAVGRDIAAGWRSAVALTAEPMGAAAPAVGPWLGVLVVASVLLGGAYTLWKRR